MSVNFKATMDDSDFRKKLEDMRKGLTDVGNTAEEEGKKIESAFSNLGKVVGGAFAGQQLIEFAKNVATVRGEFQQLEAAYRTMLGSREKADKLMQQTIEFAATTPFDLQGVASGTKQLLAYGSEVEDITEEMTMLGNIAAGLSIPLNDIVYLYGTTRAQGRMFTQDLRQFMGRGIPLAEELAKQFGVTSAKVGQLVTDGKVGFEEMRKALAAMTEEGGKFSGLMDAQSKTISGQISNLEDSVQQMFNNIGKASEGLISGAISTVAGIVENYEQVGRVMLELIATFGTYKAAIIAVNVVNKIRLRILEETIIQEKLAAASGITLSKAQAVAAGTSVTLSTALKGAAASAKAFVTSAGGIVAIATALGYGIYKLITYQTDYEKGLEKLNDAFSEGNKEANAQISTLAQLKGKLSALKEGTQEYADTQKKIADIAKEYGVQLKEEEVSVDSLALKYKGLTAAIQESFDARAYDTAIKGIEESWNSSLTSGLDGMYEKLVSSFGDERGAELFQNIKDSIMKAYGEGGNLDLYMGDLSKVNIPYMEEMESAKATRYWNQIAFAYRDYLKLTAEARKKYQPTKKDDGVSIDGDASVPTSYGMDYKKAEKKWQEAKAKLTEIEKNKRKFTADQYKAAAEAEKSAREAYEDLGGDPKGDERKKEQNAKEQERLQKKALEKEKKYQEELIELARQSKEEQDQVALDGMTDQISIIEQKANMARAKIEAERAAFKREYGEDADTSSFDARIKTVDDSEGQQKKQYVQSLVEQYRSIEQQREDIVKEHQKNINALRAAGEQEAADEAEKVLNKELNAFDMKTGKVFKEIFRDVAHQTKSQLVANLKLANNAVKEMTDPEAIAKMEEQIASLSDEIAGIEPIDLDTDWKSVLKSLREIEKKKKALSLIDDKSSEAALELNSQIERLQENTNAQLAGAGINGFIEGLQKASDIIKEMSGMLSNDIDEELSAASDLLGSIVQGYANGGLAGAVIGAFTSVVEGMSEDFQKVAESGEKYANAFWDFHKSLMLAKYEIDSDDYSTIFGIKQLEEARVAAEKAKEAYEAYIAQISGSGSTFTFSRGQDDGRKVGEMREQLEGILYDLQKIQVMTVERNGFAKLFGAEDEYQDLVRVAPELWNMESRNNENYGEFDVDAARELLNTDIAISETDRKRLEYAVELYDAYEEAQAILNEVAESYFGEVSSNWAESIWDNYIKYGESAISYVSEDMNDSLSEVAANFGKQMLAELLNTMLTEAYADRLKKIITGESEESMPDMIGEMLNDMKTWTENGLAFTEEYQKAMEAAGLKLNTEEETSGTSGGFATMSQQSADELSGRFADLQMKGTAIQGFAEAISINVEEMRGIALLNNDYLRQVAENSAFLKAMDTTIKSIRKKMEDL